MAEPLLSDEQDKAAVKSATEIVAGRPAAARGAAGEGGEKADGGEGMRTVDVDDVRTGRLRVPAPPEFLQPSCCSCGGDPKPARVGPVPVLVPRAKDECKTVAVKTVAVVCNPFGGNGRGRRAWPIVKEVFEKAGVAITYLKTEYAGHASEMLANPETLKGQDALCVIGGDGTINECIQGLMELREKHRQDFERQAKEKNGDGDDDGEEKDGAGGKAYVPLTIPPVCFIPGGTGNSVCVSLGELDTDPAAAARNLINGAVTSIDLARVTFEGTGKVTYSFNVIVWGIGADASATAEKLRWMGQKRYDAGGLWQILRMPDYQATFEIDGQRMKDDYIFAMIQNNQHSGVRLRFAPYARMDDGVMDLLAMPRASRGDLFTLFDEVKRDGCHVFNKDMKYFRFKKLRIIADKPSIINVDGELPGSTPITVEIVPGVLPIFYNAERFPPIK